jgi:inosose dehydratase
MRISLERLLFRDHPLRKFLHLATRLGVEGVEFSEYELARQVEAGAYTHQELGRDVRQHGLEISGIYWSAPFHVVGERDRILGEARRLANEYRGMECFNVVIGPPRRMYGASEEERVKILTETAKTLESVGRVFRDHGIRASLHNHYDTTIETGDELEFVMKNVESELLGFCPDTAHLVLADMDPLEIIGKYLDRTTYVHLKDVKAPSKIGMRDDRWFMRTTELGRGVVDFPAVLRLLKDAGRVEWLVVEQDYSELAPEESAVASIGYLRRSIGQL